MSKMPIRLVPSFKIPYRLIEHGNTIILYPDHWPPYYNGGILCTMLQGPCDCGATHSLTEWMVSGLTYEEKALEIAEKYDAFLPRQMFNIAISEKVPAEELDIWMYCMRCWQPCLFKANIVSGLGSDQKPDRKPIPKHDYDKVQEYMKKLMSTESKNAESTGSD